MDAPPRDTWTPRDLPVLRAVVRQYDETLRAVPVGDIEATTGLSKEDVQRAIFALVGDGLVEGHGRNPAFILRVGGVTGEARRRVGEWPTADVVADRFLEALKSLAENSSDPVERSKAAAALDAFGKFSRDTIVSVIGAAAGVALQ